MNYRAYKELGIANSLLINALPARDLNMHAMKKIAGQ
jgi:hypothetical protein